jgi:hypothetical protein
MYIYVAGPYTNGDTILNIQQAIATGDKLRELGFTPFIPHMTYAWHMLCPHTIDYWYKYDLEWLERCNAVFRILGKSTGADEEVRYALEELQIPVFYDFPTLISYAQQLEHSS